MRENQTVITPADELIHEYCRGFMEKVFYFCLRKTGNPSSAEELCSDISLAVMTALRKGIRPENFAAWVWQVARNRHADYAESRRKTRERSCGDDISEYELDDGSEPMDDKLVREEELNLLRRELAFISCDYRNVLVAFYIDDRSLKDISRSLNLPENTVKSKLHRARKILKEGINMAREFGTKSYKPEEVSFSGSGWFPATDSPYDAVKKKIAKNILLEASNNPETAEELAMALGIAMPYMEEEIDDLVRVTLLKKVGDKYITNIPILSREIQKKLYDIQLGHAAESAELVKNIAEYALPRIKALGCIRNGKITDNELMWWISDDIIRNTSPLFPAPKVRENGEKWQLVGFEKADHPAFGGLDNNSTASNGFSFARQTVVGLGGDCDLPKDQIRTVPIALLADVIRNDRNVSTFTESEKQLWKEVEGVYAHTEPDGSVVPDILVFEGGTTFRTAPQASIDIYACNPDYEKFKALQEKVRKELIDALTKDNSPLIADQMSLIASMSNRFCDITLMRLVDSGALTPLTGSDRFKGTSWILIS